MEGNLEQKISSPAERDRQEVLKVASSAGWYELKKFHSEYLQDPEIVTAALARFEDPVAAHRELELEIPLSVRAEVRKRLVAVRDGEWAKSFEVRVEKWKVDLRKELGGLSVTGVSSLPDNLKRTSQVFVDIKNAGALMAQLRDGKTALFQVFPSGHYFAAEVYSPTGEYLGGNHDYTWDEFRDNFLK